MIHTEYTALKYKWRLFEGDEQIGTGGFETKARMEYESQEALDAGDAPITEHHHSAYMKSRHQAKVELLALGKFPIGGGNWGKWRAEKDEGFRSAPLLVDGQEAFRLHLEVTNDV